MRSRMDIQFPTNFNTFQICADGMEVGDARNFAVETCLNAAVKPEFLFFLDYDVLPSYDCVRKLLYRARHFPGHDIFAGVYCTKSSIPEPLIYKDWGIGPHWDWTMGDVITEGIVGVHMGLTLIRTSLLEKMRKEIDGPLFKTTNEVKTNKTGLHTVRGTEDLFFCDSAVSKFGAKILVDTSVMAGHQDVGSGRIFGLLPDSMPIKRAQWHPANKATEKLDDAGEPTKIALDLGAGEHKRKWDGYKTFSTDIREGVGVDYVMDTRLLNLPNDHFDLVASSHHLEHIGRWDQDQVWSEMFRIVKPGGTIEHIVPSVEWAGCKLADGVAGDMEHVQNVLYGAQEAHGYAREFNLHYIGFTKGLIAAMAQQAGFVDVEVEDWRERPELGYNLICRATKPLVVDDDEVKTLADILEDKSADEATKINAA